jgi:hypothetical protein
MDVSLTAQEALQKTQRRLNEAMIDFDRWVSSNPNMAVPTNVEYRIKQQNIKLLRLKMKELEQMKNDYSNTLMVLYTSPKQGNPNVPTRFTKSRTGSVTTGIHCNKLGKLTGNKVSLGNQNSI